MPEAPSPSMAKTVARKQDTSVKKEATPTWLGELPQLGDPVTWIRGNAKVLAIVTNVYQRTIDILVLAPGAFPTPVTGVKHKNDPTYRSGEDSRGCWVSGTPERAEK